ncbi:MAG: 6,7-dimethyl-8-ribityllumazine synthase [Phycisphaerales bacterium]
MPEPVAIIVSRYNASITTRLLDAAITEYLNRGGKGDDLAIIEAPGAFELPALASAAIQTGQYAGVCCLGCVLKGETSHNEHINTAVSQGLASLAVATGLPVAFGVLTCDTAEQAEARAGGAKGNKGREAMAALLEAIDACRAIDRAADAETPGFRHTVSINLPDKLKGERRVGGKA